MKLALSTVFTALVATVAIAQPAQNNPLNPPVRGVIAKDKEKEAGVPTGPAPMLKSGKPDMSGVWEHPYVPDFTRNANGQQGAGELPFSALGLAKWKSYDAAQGDYTGNCLPFGLVRSVNAPYPIQIIQNDTDIAFLFEQNTWFHSVAIDGKPHPKEVDLTWHGSSVGRWDGDTLVIDTIGFNGKTRLDTLGHPLSDQLHVIERFRRVDAGHISYETTIDDPLFYTKPFTNVRTFTLRPDWKLLEYSCEENNKDVTAGHIKVWTGTTPAP
jgi:hypothetical protein